MVVHASQLDGHTKFQNSCGYTERLSQKRGEGKKKNPQLQ